MDRSADPCLNAWMSRLTCIFTGHTKHSNLFKNHKVNKNSFFCEIYQQLKQNNDVVIYIKMFTIYVTPPLGIRLLYAWNVIADFIINMSVNLYSTLYTCYSLTRGIKIISHILPISTLIFKSSPVQNESPNYTSVKIHSCYLWLSTLWAVLWENGHFKFNLKPAKEM
jgi:hypothetical protein